MGAEVGKKELGSKVMLGVLCLWLTFWADLHGNCVWVVRWKLCNLVCCCGDTSGTSAYVGGSCCKMKKANKGSWTERFSCADVVRVMHMLSHVTY